MNTSQKPSNNNAPFGRNLVEGRSFTDAVAKIGGHELVDSALSAVIDGLCNGPEGFDLIPGFEPIRIAKTDAISRPDGQSCNAMHLWFIIESETTIRLLYVEEILSDE